MGSFTPSALSISRNRPTAISESPPRSKKSASCATDGSRNARHQIASRAASCAIADSCERGRDVVLCGGDLAQPGAEDGARDRAARRDSVGEDGELVHQRSVALTRRAGAEAVEQFLFRRVEIEARSVRISLALAGQIAPHVADIFAAERLRVVFGMALEEEHAVAALLDEQLHARVVGFGEDAVAAFAQRLRRHLVPTRMRDAEAGGQGHGQIVMTAGRMLEQAEAFVLQRTALDAVIVQHRGMACEARERGRRSVAVEPVEQVRERVPERLVFQVRVFRLGAGDDHRVEARGHKLRKILVRILRQMTPPRIAALHAAQRIKRDEDAQLRRRRVDHVEELACGREQGRVRHVVDDAELEAFEAPSGARAFQDRGHQDQPTARLGAISMTSPADASSACVRSAMMSSTCSMPMHSRIISGFTPACSSCASVNWRCVVEAGWQASDLQSPILTSRLKSLSASWKRLPASKPPLTPKVRKAGPRPPRYFFDSAWLGSFTWPV